MAIVTTICNNKGGVAKTKTTVTLAAGAVRRGFRVLVIDLDGQHNATSTTVGTVPGLDTGENPSIMDWLTKKSTFEQTIFPAVSGWGFDLMPGSIATDNFDASFPSNGFDSPHHLLDGIQKIKGRYDLILIDTGPSLNTALANAAMASDTLLMVSTVNKESLDGVLKTASMMGALKRAFNPTLTIDGVLLTMVKSYTKSGRESMEVARQCFTEAELHCFETHIRDATAMGKLSYFNRDICVVDPTHNVAKDYESFIQEWLVLHEMVPVSPVSPADTTVPVDEH